MDDFQGHAERSVRGVPNQLIEQVSVREVPNVLEPSIGKLREGSVLGGVVGLLESRPWHDAGQSRIGGHQLGHPFVEIVPVLRQHDLQPLAQLFEHVVIVRSEAHDLPKNTPRLLGRGDDPILPDRQRPIDPLWLGPKALAIVVSHQIPAGQLLRGNLSICHLGVTLTAWPPSQSHPPTDPNRTAPDPWPAGPSPWRPRRSPPAPLSHPCRTY